MLDKNIVELDATLESKNLELGSKLDDSELIFSDLTLENDTVEINVNIESATLELKSNLTSPEVSVNGIVNPIDQYDGLYSVTPTDTTQTIDTKNKLLTNNIVVEPIPSNYGKIVWNGSTLSVI